MADFRILQTLSAGAMRFTTTVVDAHVVDDIAHAPISTTKGVSNPLNILTMGQIGTGVFRPDIVSKTASTVVRGNGASAFDDAVRALHELGARHGVDGILLGADPNRYGGVKLLGSGSFQSGAPVLRRLGQAEVGGGRILGRGDQIEAGRRIAMNIDVAARRVMDFAEAAR